MIEDRNADYWRTRAYYWRHKATAPLWKSAVTTVGVASVVMVVVTCIVLLMRWVQILSHAVGMEPSL